MATMQSHKRLCIIFIIDNLKVGGAQIHLLRLVAVLKERFDLEIISLGPCSDKLIEQMKERVKITYFNMSSIKETGNFLISFIKLVVYLKKVRPNIVHTYLNTANVFGLLAARVAGITKIVTSRRDMGQFRTGRIAALESFLSRHVASEVFCVCNAVAEATHFNEKISRIKIKELLNGVDIHLYKSKNINGKRDKLTFTMIAAMDREEKGHRDLLAAINLMSCSRSKIRFLFVGEGPLHSALESEARSLDIESLVHFMGEQSDVVPLLEQSDVLVVPSHSEGLSNAILEAMAMGIPIIATAVDGNLEVVVHNKTGCLVQARNPEALAEMLCNYVDNPHLIKQHGTNARERVEKGFSLEIMRKSYFEAYEEVLGI